MSRARVAALALVALGLLAGTALDDAPVRPPIRRAGLRVLECDFHAHTRLSDGLLAPWDLVLHARRNGLDAIAVTEHNMTLAAFLARGFSRAIGGPEVLIGEEITTRGYHLIAVGLRARVDASAPLSEVLATVHAQGGVAIAAHPVRRFWPGYEPHLAELDGAEVMHPIAWRSGGGWAWDDMLAFYARAEASPHRLAAIGSSDYHFGSPLGVARTLVFAEDVSSDAIVDAIRKGRTVVYDRGGRAYGDPELVSALEREPYFPRAIDYGYHGAGLLDRIARVLGLVGLFGLVAVGGRRANASPGS